MPIEVVGEDDGWTGFTAPGFAGQPAGGLRDPSSIVDMDTEMGRGQPGKWGGDTDTGAGFDVDASADFSAIDNWEKKGCVCSSETEVFAENPCVTDPWGFTPEVT
eukprot:Rmarinus@m.28344